MGQFSLIMLFGGIVAIIAWSVVDNVIHDREGVRRKRAEDAIRQRERAQVLRSRR